MRFCSLTRPSVSASVRWHLQRGGIRLGQSVFSTSSLVGTGTWVPTSRKRWCSPSWGIPQLSTVPWNSLPVFFISAATTVTSLLCYVLWLSNAAPLGPAGWSPSPWSLPLPDCMCVCVGHPCCRGETGSPLFFSPSSSEKINYSISLTEASFCF